MPQRLAAILFCLWMPGCVIVDVGVTNPVPGMSRIAVAPFRNLSGEPDLVVDGRRVAMAYYSELQQVPGFEVVPVGVTEIAMIENGLQLTSPESALELARILEVDAIVVGAVTEYDPYYPPRIGLHVEWMSPEPWAFQPGVQTDPARRKKLFDAIRERIQAQCKRPQPRRYGRPEILRGQPVDRPRVTTNSPTDLSLGEWRPSPPETGHTAVPESRPSNAARQPVTMLTHPASPRSTLRSFPLPQTPPPGIPPRKVVQMLDPPLPAEAPVPGKSADSTLEIPPLPTAPAPKPGKGELTLPPLDIGPNLKSGMPPNRQVLLIPAASPLEPLMSYSRIFDGANGDLVAELRDYAELSGDQRSGGWEAYLQRSGDFIRFACRRMIVEMLTLHGGEGKRRIVFKWRKYR